MGIIERLNENKYHLHVQFSRNKSWRLVSVLEFWASFLPLIFGTTRTAELSALITDRNLSPRKFLGNHFLLEAECNPMLPHADRKNRSLELFQRSYRESNPEPLVLWRRASPDCPTAHPLLCNVVHTTGMISLSLSLSLQYSNCLFVFYQVTIHNKFSKSPPTELMHA